ncbi:MAG: sigma-70 family RNA polymerase sigma factor [Anaerolineae bacterium]|nr:sigma-70 family RNA polymerase sigma factor [Anaerolineae bacterium]MDW8069414.1 sigma-70 family RNA polymerase sigma factor [Anaerolineae bacterium]
MTLSTEDLIRRFQRGQPLAFEALYDRYRDYVYRIAFFLTRNSGDAEEVVQDTFLDLLRALPAYRIEGPARFETYLYRLTVNRCRAHLRRQPPPSADWDALEDRLERIPSLHPEEDDPEIVTLSSEQALLLWQAVDRLPEQQRIVILLRYQLGLSYLEIARALNLPVGTVKSRLHQAHQTLKARLQSVVQDSSCAALQEV